SVDVNRVRFDWAECGAQQITNHIGSGGICDVYRATDTKLMRRVAINFFQRPSVTTGNRWRFQREGSVFGVGLSTRGPFHKLVVPYTRSLKDYWHVVIAWRTPRPIRNCFARGCGWDGRSVSRA